MKSMPPEKFEFQVKWWPFQLDPNMPLRKNKLESYRRKFGAARVEAMLPHMQAVGREEGIEFSYGGDMGNTFDSHRLVNHARRQGKEDAMMEQLFKMYFEQERNLGDQATLLEAAEAVGVTGVKDMLDSEEGVSEVQAQLEAKARNITGVPHFIFNNRYQVSGAQEPPALIDIFKKLEKQ